jgi:ribosome-binding protein aMBF1 (putative translation factor)
MGKEAPELKREVECAVCGQVIRGSIPVMVVENERSLSICSRTCHERFEEDPAKYERGDRGREKPWFSRRRRSSP